MAFSSTRTGAPSTSASAALFGCKKNLGPNTRIHEFAQRHAATISFALAPEAPIRLASLAPNARAEVQLPLTFNGQRFKMEPINLLQMAFKNNVQVFYGQTSVPIQAVMSDDGKADPPTYMKFWQEVRTAVRGRQDYSLAKLTNSTAIESA